jgi:hypothetical protein
VDPEHSEESEDFRASKLLLWPQIRAVPLGFTAKAAIHECVTGRQDTDDRPESDIAPPGRGALTNRPSLVNCYI